MKNLKYILLLIIFTINYAFCENEKVFTVELAVKLAIENNVEVNLLEKQLKISKINIKNSKKLKNPEIEYEIENFGGGNSFKGLDNSESTFKISQEIQLFGKRNKKTRIATFESEIDLVKFKNKKSEIILETEKRYFKVLANLRNLNAIENNLKLHKKSYNLIESLVNSGKKPLSDKRRAFIELQKYEILKKHVEMNYKNSIIDLLNICGEEIHGKYKFKDNLENIKLIKIGSKKLENVEKSPLLNNFKNIISVQNEKIKFEKAKKIPNLSIYGGLKKFKEIDEKAYVAGLSFELPIFNRNKNNIAIEKVNLEKATIEKKYLEKKILNNLKQIKNQIDTSINEINIYKEEILPIAKEEVESVELGYKEGKHSFIDVMNSLNVLNELETTYTEKLYTYKTLTLEYLYLTGELIKNI